MELEKFHSEAASLVAGVPRGAHRRDVLCEARLFPLDAIVRARTAEYYLTATLLGGALGEAARTMFPPAHQVHQDLALLRDSYQEVDDFATPLAAPLLRHRVHAYFNIRLPDNLTADSPLAERRAACIKRIDAFKDYEYSLWADGSAIADDSSGAAAMLYHRGRCIA